MEDIAIVFSLIAVFYDNSVSSIQRFSKKDRMA